MVKIAFLLMCHKNANRVNEPIKQLSTDNRDFYVHVDAKSNIYSDICWSDNVFPTKKRIDVQWGDVTQCYAEFELMKTAMSGGKKYDYYWLISGQDYPIKTNSQIDKYLELNPHISYININELTSASHINKQKRNEIWYPKNKNRFISKAFIKFYETISGGKHTFPIFKRKNTLGMDFRFGANWFCLNHDCFKYVYNTLENQPHILKFFENAMNPDECFVQTLVYASPYKNQVQSMLTHVEWIEGRPNPIILSEESLQSLKNSDKLIARKFEEIPNCIKKLSQEG